MIAIHRSGLRQYYQLVTGEKPQNQFECQLWTTTASGEIIPLENDKTGILFCEQVVKELQKYVACFRLKVADSKLQQHHLMLRA